MTPPDPITALRIITRNARDYYRKADMAGAAEIADKLYQRLLDHRIPQPEHIEQIRQFPKEVRSI